MSMMTETGITGNSQVSCTIMHINKSKGSQKQVRCKREAKHSLKKPIMRLLPASVETSSSLSRDFLFPLEGLPVPFVETSSSLYRDFLFLLEGLPPPSCSVCKLQEFVSTKVTNGDDRVEQGRVEDAVLNTTGR